ncbi:uncharacterized protein LOC117167338 isoform X2 [Belonocnema kinseyi]|uniref:uncharacterized protein LOC117167338 isoform X2 n=1 Tax=Belonocnema kinseyi TaxID=2817044 RepID=UPI00143CE641|nr:uncharacterized protein LOC117167338 isoform X2 [Belonocnema kinseyi]
MEKSRMKLHENRCRQCKKLFCCVNCRLAHESKKHSERELKCDLCCSKKLQIRGDESHEFICHLVFHHLPLLCRLCGQSFESNQDLVVLQKCGWWKTENSKRLLKVLGKSFPSTPSSKIKASLNVCNNKEPVTKNRHSGDFVTFNSPPVLTRNTSTPMQIGLNAPKGNSEFKCLTALSFLLKTPKKFSPSLEDRGSWPIIDSSEIKRFNSDSQYCSGISSYSRSSFQGSSLSHKTTNSSTSTTTYFTCDNPEIDSCTRSDLGSKVKETPEVEVPNKKEVKESTKRVRFSDQLGHLTKMAENDEFFEAYENLSVTSYKPNDKVEEPKALEEHTEGTSDVSANKENEMNVLKENKVSFEENNNFLEENKVQPKENEVCLRENDDCRKENVVSPQENGICLKGNEVFRKENEVCLKENEASLEENQVPVKENKVNFKENQVLDTKFHPEEDKENSVPNIQTGSSNPGPSGDNPAIVEQSGSSRVVMMVLVENKSRFSRSELAPLIDSGLKKLEETASSMGSVYSSVGSRSSRVERNSSELRETGPRRRSVTSVNSYLSFTSTECFSAQSGSQWNSSNERSSPERVESSKPEGIFSTVARVVRSALRKLPGGSPAQVELREPRIPQSRAAIASTSASTPTPTSTSTLRPSSYDSTSSLSSTCIQPPTKRPRDPISPPEITGSTFENEERSPIAKRPRGWYKIKAREPIARMRKIQVASPKGVSSETQRFQQGSLSVGRENTILPLPSRAHQCTQTELD